jgi:hypothetical protein
MTATNKLFETLEHALPTIDDCLSAANLPPARRPLLATIEFIQCFIEEVSEDGGKAIQTIREAKDFVKAPWFAMLYGRIEVWYRDRYGAALNDPTSDCLRGLVAILGAPFAIEVPRAVMRPDKPGETAWFSFPDWVLENEKSAGWIVGPPNLDKLDANTRASTEKLSTEVAGSLRCINSNLTGVKVSDEKMRGLTAGILPALEHAVELILKQDRASLQRAYWELQITCEFALKALQQQKCGRFTETHDLFVLWDRVPAPGPAFSRDTLKAIPRWEEMISLRYGQGAREDITEWFGCYRATLKVVIGSVKTMNRLHLGGAQFLIARPPWIRK